MNHTISLVLSIALLVSFAFTNTTAQDSEVRSLSSFDGIAVSASVDAELVKGSKDQAEVTVKGIELERVVTEIENGILKVGMRKNKLKWKWTKGSRVKVIVTYAEDPGYVSVSSSADVIGHDKIVADQLELKASSSGDMKLDIQASQLEVTVSSSADLIISGTADHAKVTVSSSGDFLGKNLKVDNANLSASSSGDLEISVEKSIEAHASSSGDIIYYGNPGSKNVSKSSGGDISHRN